MTDDLRDRIARVLSTYMFENSTTEELADAVIEELGLRQQVAGPDGIAYGKHRYVTDWIAND